MVCRANEEGAESIMKQLIKPPKLNPGNKVAIVSLSWGGAGDDFNDIETLRECGISVASLMP